MNKTQLQHQGFLETESIFLTENPFLNQPLFQCKKNNNPISLDLVVKENLMLGKRAESFFKQELIDSDAYNFLAENIQIFKNKITIGELDFIIQEKETKNILHVELTYKFYLYDPQLKQPEIEKWIGPNRKDTLSLKIKKLNEHQFPLLHTKEAKQVLENIIPTLQNTQQKTCFKAQLFVPHSLMGSEFPFINPKTIRGTYSSLDAFLENNLGSYKFYIPRKQDWLISPKNNTTWFSFNSIEKELSEKLAKQKSPLVWIQKDDNTFESIFIVWWQTT